MFEDIAGRVVASRRSDFSFKYGIARVGKILNGKTGQEYIFATRGRGGRDFELFSERVRLPAREALSAEGRSAQDHLQKAARAVCCPGCAVTPEQAMPSCD
jgi:hypothetical protein